MSDTRDGRVDGRGSFREEIRTLMKKGVDLEYAYAEDTMPRGVLGLNATMFKEYTRVIEYQTGGALSWD